MAVPVDERMAPRPRRRSTPPTSTGRCACGSTRPPIPTGAVDDLAAVSAWGRTVGVPVFSDECYVEFTWEGQRPTILAAGLDGVMAVHSLSKRSNLAGVRAGFYAGDPELVRFLSEVRKHAGLMVPGPVQAAAAAALDDDDHVEAQRTRYRERLAYFRDILGTAGRQGRHARRQLLPVGRGARRGCLGLRRRPGHPRRDAGGARRPLRRGLPVHVRVALVQPMDRLRLAAERLSA